MRNTRVENPNPDVEEIMQAYLKTHMTERQFEELVEKAIRNATSIAGPADVQASYDKGFSEGYDSAIAESR
jgi:hypothetical protein